MVAEQAEALSPHSAGQWRRARRTLRTGLQCRLAVRIPTAAEILTEPGSEGRIFLGRRGTGDRIPARLWPAARARSHTATLIVSPEGLVERGDAADAGVISRLCEGGQTVLAIDVLGVGEHGAALIPGGQFFTTYNRTLLAEQVQDALTALAFLRARRGIRRVNLMGEGAMGPVSLLARALDPSVARTAVDADGFEYAADRDEPADRALPGILRFGGLRAAAALAAPGPLLLHHTAGALDPTWAQRAYELEGHPGAFQTSAQRLSTDEVVRWLLG